MADILTRSSHGIVMKVCIGASPPSGLDPADCNHGIRMRQTD